MRRKKFSKPLVLEMSKFNSLPIAILLFLPFCLTSQTESDFVFMNEANYGIKSARTIQPSNQKTKKDKNDIQQTGQFLFHVYKNYITTQDGNYCNFIPSCSSYCAQALHKHGPVKGAIMSFDRMGRCHGFAPQKYTFDPKRRKLIDEPK